MIDKCPKCGMEKVSALHPGILYACGSSDLDRRPGIFWQSPGCKRIAVLNEALKVYMGVYKYRGLRGAAKIAHEKISKALSEGGADDDANRI